MLGDENWQRPTKRPLVRLAGQLPDSGFSTPQWLVERDGQFIQVTEALYRILEESNGARTVEEIAERITATSDWIITGEQVLTLVRSRLAPLSLVTDADADGSELRRVQGPTPLRLQRRTTVLSAAAVERVTRILQWLYAPPVVALVIGASVAAHLWLYAYHGVADSLQQTLYTPGLLPLVVATMLFAGVTHEFGHAAALRYGGGRARAMGVGFYAIYPAFYTDTTDAYRLGRGARVRTDLGGFYFYLIFSLALSGLYAVTGYEFLLLVVLLIDLDILYQCLPFVRLDGYWVLADLTGLPDPFSYMEPFVRSLVRRSSGQRLPQLKPWVRRVFVGYVVLTLPVLVILLVAFLMRAPWLFATTWQAYFTNLEALFAAARGMNFTGALLAGMQALLLGLIMLGILFFVYDIGRKLLSALRAGAQVRQATAA